MNNENTIKNRRWMYIKKVLSSTDYFDQENIQDTYTDLKEEIRNECPGLVTTDFLQELRKRAKYCFVMGLDKDFDYSKIDQDLLLDDLLLDAMQEEWFNVE